MRALPLLMSLVGAMVMSASANGARASNASALWPIARSLGAESGTAQVEVFSTSTVKKKPPVRILEQEILPGASWRASQLGNGELYVARSGNRFARIAYVPQDSALTLVCATDVEVSADAIGGALAASATPPCGPRQVEVTMVTTLPERPSPAEVRRALGRIGAVQRGLVHGPKGLLALADVPGRDPEVAIGGVSMNLAVEITYDSAHGAKAVLATPTIPGSEP